MNEKIMKWMMDNDVQWGELIESEGGDEIIVVYDYKQENALLKMWPEDEKQPDIVYGDSYTQCDNCYNWYHTIPQYYGDVIEQWVSEDGCFCGDCVRKELADEYLEYVLERTRSAKEIGDFPHVNMLDENGWLEEHGFVEIDARFKRGLHRFQRDNPLKIVRAIEACLNDWMAKEQEWQVDVVFMISAGQFDVAFTPYIRILAQETRGGELIPYDEEEVKIHFDDAVKDYYKPDAKGPGDIVAEQLQELSRQSRG